MSTGDVQGGTKKTTTLASIALQFLHHVAPKSIKTSRPLPAAAENARRSSSLSTSVAGSSSSCCCGGVVPATSSAAPDPSPGGTAAGSLFAAGALPVSAVLSVCEPSPFSPPEPPTPTPGAAGVVPPAAGTPGKTAAVVLVGVVVDMVADAAAAAATAVAFEAVACAVADAPAVPAPAAFFKEAISGTKP